MAASPAARNASRRLYRPGWVWITSELAFNSFLHIIVNDADYEERLRTKKASPIRINSIQGRNRYTSDGDHSISFPYPAADYKRDVPWQ